MDFKSSSTNWIWAVKDGSPIKTDSQSANIQQHDDMDTFTFDLTKARGGSSLNPFISTASTTGSASSGGTAPVATTPAAGAGAGAGAGAPASNDSDSDSGSSDSSSESISSTVENATIAHGTIMGLAFVLFYPIGAMTIRLLSFPGVVWVHAGMQAFAYLFALTGLGLGIYIAIMPVYQVSVFLESFLSNPILLFYLRTALTKYDHLQQLNMYHPIIGLVVIGCLLIQPILGYINHVMYARLGKASLWSTAHVWFGRTILTLGIINGGLGLRFAGNTTKGEIAYGVIACVVWVSWLAVAVWATVYKKGPEEGSGNPRDEATTMAEAK